jgi:acyl-CoA thioester hydrolase
MPFAFPSKIRFVDTDASGRIHYTAMLRHFEAAEHEFLESLGCSYQAGRGFDVDFPRVHVEVDFMIPLAYNDPIEVQVTVERIGNTSFTLAFLTLLHGQPAAKGRIVVVAIDHKTRRPCPLPERLVKCLSKPS